MQVGISYISQHEAFTGIITISGVHLAGIGAANPKTHAIRHQLDGRNR